MSWSLILEIDCKGLGEDTGDWGQYRVGGVCGLGRRDWGWKNCPSLQGWGFSFPFGVRFLRVNCKKLLIVYMCVNSPCNLWLIMYFLFDSNLQPFILNIFCQICLTIPILMPQYWYLFINNKRFNSWVTKCFPPASHQTPKSSLSKSTTVLD